MYQNIISPDIVSFRRYFVIGEYNTLDEAKAKLDVDVENWKSNNKVYYKRNYPFAWATIKG
ncbi:MULTISPECIES: hypothetical protein [Bacteria]|uniref:hypothetical protein n=1 Tax=Bacteria TaxID=2 RepID=UPI002558000E|nr:hypothetical protein [Bacteroides acidifaciens]